jgi:prepilin-type N-terminal cleavage/methylation domain-containing protein
MHTPHRNPSGHERGTTLAELMVALVVLSIGILAVAQLFPAGTRTQVQSRMTNTANYYAQEKLEQLRSLDWANADLTAGRHPTSGTEALGTSGQWQRFYEVTAMAAPLGNLKRVDVAVYWGRDTVTSTTYVRR